MTRAHLNFLGLIVFSLDGCLWLRENEVEEPANNLEPHIYDWKLRHQCPGLTLLHAKKLNTVQMK